MNESGDIKKINGENVYSTMHFNKNTTILRRTPQRKDVYFHNLTRQYNSYPTSYAPHDMTSSFEDFSDLEPIPLNENHADNYGGGGGDRALKFSTTTNSATNQLTFVHGPPSSSSPFHAGPRSSTTAKKRSSSSTFRTSAMKRSNSRKYNSGGHGEEILVRQAEDIIATSSSSTTTSCSTSYHPHDHDTGDAQQVRIRGRWQGAVLSQNFVLAYM